MTDLNENMSSEEIAAFAESLVNEITEERSGERKSDAEIVVDTSADVVVDEPVDDVAAADDGEGSGDSDVPEWLTDEVKAEVAAYGIEESDLSDFTSREELDRVLRLLDKKALESGREALAEGQTRNDKGQFVKKADDAAGKPEEAAPQESRYEVSLSEDLYDEEIVSEFNRMKDYYESRLNALESRFTEVNAQAEEQKFDTYVDSLGHADLFGKTGKESQKELDRRKDLMVAVKAQMIGLEKLGRPAELTDQLVARVANMVFSDELAKKRLKQQTSKISRQSNLRQGGSPTKPTPVRDDPREEADRLYKELSRS
jgi:hypothetical protein